MKDGYNGYAWETQEDFLNGLDHVLYDTDGIDYGYNSELMMKPYSTEEFARSVEKVYQKVIGSKAVPVEV